MIRYCNNMVPVEEYSSRGAMKREPVVPIVSKDNQWQGSLGNTIGSSYLWRIISLVLANILYFFHLSTLPRLVFLPRGTETQHDRNTGPLSDRD